MIPVAFDYQRPSTLEEALGLLRDHAGEARPLAGGHSLIPLMKLRLSAPGMLVDIARIPDLAGLDGGDPIRIGANTTHAALESSTLLKERVPALSDAAAEIGDPQVRHRGTIGGSLAHADPAGDLPAVVVALEADIVVAGARGERSIPASDFFQDLFTVDLADDEIITGVRTRPAPASAYAKLRQRASHYALVGVACVLEMDGATCRSARLGITGAASHAQRLPAVEERLAGRELNPETIAEAGEGAAEGIGELNDDIHGSAEYRREMAKVIARRAISAAAGRA